MCVCVWIYPWREIERQEERKRRISNSEFSWRRSIPAYRLSAKFAPFAKHNFPRKSVGPRISRLTRLQVYRLFYRFSSSCCTKGILCFPREYSDIDHWRWKKRKERLEREWIECYMFNYFIGCFLHGFILRMNIKRSIYKKFHTFSDPETIENICLLRWKERREKGNNYRAISYELNLYIRIFIGIPVISIGKMSGGGGGRYRYAKRLSVKSRILRVRSGY